MSNSKDTSRLRLRRKADQHWEMAGLARKDEDEKDEDFHTKKAREYEQMLREGVE